MARKYYLTSGHSSTGELAEFDREALEGAQGKRVAIMNLTSEDREKNARKGEQLSEYFKRLGATDIILVSPDTPATNAQSATMQANLLYIPGGDTKTLLRQIEQKGLRNFLMEFRGVTLANSAGVYALTPEYLRIGRGEPEIIPATDILPIHVKCHYEERFDNDLRELSKRRPIRTRNIWALEDPSMILYEASESRRVIGFKGNVWRFFMGEKEKY